MFRDVRSLWKDWARGVEAIAAVEAALIFPILLVMLLGTFDAGRGLLAAQKTIRAAQVTADLVARHRSVTDTDLDEAITGGQLSMAPYDTTSYGVDMVSLEFEDDGDIVSLWCETRNSPVNTNITNSLGALAVPGEGIIAVTVRFDYEPTFSGFVFDTIEMQEIAYARGRLTSTVPHVSRNGC